MINRANNLLCNSWGRPPGKMGPRNFYICSVFRRLRHLMVNIFWMKRDINNRARALGRVSYIVQKFYKLCPQTALNGTRILPMHPHYFVPSQSIAHPLIGINVATLNEMTLDLSAAQIRSPTRCYVGNATASGGLKWQYVAIIATFSSSFFFCPNLWARWTELNHIRHMVE